MAQDVDDDDDDDDDDDLCGLCSHTMCRLAVATARHYDERRQTAT